MPKTLLDTSIEVEDAFRAIFSGKKRIRVLVFSISRRHEHYALAFNAHGEMLR